MGVKKSSFANYGWKNSAFSMYLHAFTLEFIQTYQFWILNVKQGM